MDGYIRSTSTPTGYFQRRNEGRAAWTDLEGVRVYGESPGHCGLQVCGCIQQLPAGQNAWPAFMHARLNITQARAVATALLEWIGVQESYTGAAERAEAAHAQACRDRDDQQQTPAGLEAELIADAAEARRAAGLTLSAIGLEFGVSRQAVHEALRLRDPEMKRKLRRRQADNALRRYYAGRR